MKIETHLPVADLLTLNSEVTVNQHGRCCLSFRLAEGVKETELKDYFEQTPVSISEIKDDGSTKRIFGGQLESVSFKTVSGLHIVEAEAVTLTTWLDLEKKRRSFQDPENTYQDIAEQILEEHGVKQHGPWTKTASRAAH